MRAELSVTTFCTFLREFSPPQGCGDRAKNIRRLKTRLWHDVLIIPSV